MSEKKLEKLSSQEKSPAIISELRDKAKALSGEAKKIPRSIEALLDKYEEFIEEGMLTPAQIKKEYEELLAMRTLKSLTQKAKKLFRMLGELDLLGGKIQTVNEILFFQFSTSDKKSIKIHLNIDRVWLKENGLEQFKERLEEGFRKIAEVVKENEQIKAVSMKSSMVKNNKKGVRELGFKIDEEIAEFAFMAREEFLEKYLAENKDN